MKTRIFCFFDLGSGLSRNSRGQFCRFSKDLKNFVFRNSEKNSESSGPTMKTNSKTRGYIIRSAAYAVFAIQFVVVISVHAQVPQIIGDENIDFCSINE